MALQKMTALIIDGRWDAHWVTMNGSDAKDMAYSAMDELASDALFDDCDDGEDIDGEDMTPDDFELQNWKDDVRLVRVWAGEHTSVPAEAALYEEGTWPDLPAAGTVIDVANGKVEVMASLPDGYKNHDNNPFIIPVKVVSIETRLRPRPSGFMTWPHTSGLMVTADNI